MVQHSEISEHQKFSLNILKSSRENKQKILQRGWVIWLALGFAMSKMEAKRQWRKNLKIMRENYFQLRNLLLSKLYID